MEIVLKKGCMEAVVTTKGGELISFKDEEEFYKFSNLI